jgi:hypothetical protein
MKKQIPLRYLHYLQGQAPDVDQPPGVTLRAVAVGALLSFGIGVGLPYSNMIIKGGLLGHNFSTPAALFSFFLFVGIINVIFGLVRRQWELYRGELATVYIMAMLATSIPTVGFSERLLPVLAGFRYYATPENKWAETFVEQLPNWLVPTDRAAIQGFYEGLPDGVPWGAWVEPLCYWLILILAVYWVTMCIMILLRRQWMDRERLLYPLVQVPLALMQEDGGYSRLKPFFHNKVMWMGFALPLLLGSFHSMHAYFPEWPQLSTYGGQGPMTMQMTLFHSPVIVMLNFGLVGFAYLLSRDVAAGVWLFFLLANFQRTLFRTFGFHSDEVLSRFANLSTPFLAHQAMGAMIVLVMAGLWASREHLRDVARKVRGGGGETIDDSTELLPYRAAVLGLAVGLIVISAWLWSSGVPLWVVPVFLFAVFVVFVALTRAVVEGGVAFLRTPLTPADFVISGLGTSVIGTSGVVGLGLTYIWAANLRLFFMPCFANALKIAEEIGERKRRLLWAIAIAVVLALAGSIWTVMHLSYKYGGVNLHHFWFIGVPRNAGNYLQQLLAVPRQPSVSGWVFTGIGAAAMGAFTLARSYFLWWPIHPLGFAISTFYIMNYVWFSVFVSWLAKTLTLRLGGPKYYRASRPFFLGLIMGQVFVTGLWLVIDHFTGMMDNQPIGGSFV